MLHPTRARILRVRFPEVSSRRHRLRTVLLRTAKGGSWVRSAICIRCLQCPGGERSVDFGTASVSEVLRPRKEPGGCAGICFSWLFASWVRSVICRLRAPLGGLLLAVCHRLGARSQRVPLRRARGLVYLDRRCLDSRQFAPRAVILAGRGSGWPRDALVWHLAGAVKLGWVCPYVCLADAPTPSSLGIIAD